MHEKLFLRPKLLNIFKYSYINDLNHSEKYFEKLNSNQFKYAKIIGHKIIH